MKNIKSNFKSPQRRKSEGNKTTNESRYSFVARYSFGVLASLIFVIHFVISLFNYKSFVKTFRGYPQFYTLSLLLNDIQKGEYTLNT